MSKTVDLQVEKAQTLIDGLRKHIADVTDKGIKEADLNAMEAQLAKLKTVNEECDRMRAETSAKVKAMNEVLNSVKEMYADKKKIIKGYYPQDEWMRYGVPDKR